MATTAAVIADSVSEAGKRIISLQLEYPRIVHEELLTHRAFSRSASGSRAIPVEKSIARIRSDPFIPLRWGRNQRGMQAKEELDPTARIEAAAEWISAVSDGLQHAEKLRNIGVHKQLANRIIEPWSHIHVVVTATEWENFFMLRLHDAAQDEFQVLAQAMLDAIKGSVPRTLRPGQWHLPYVTEKEHEFTPHAIMWSVARCARVSYIRHGADNVDHEADEVLYADLLQQGHMGPFEHQATASQDVRLVSGNFIGWQQYRKLLPNESVWPLNPRAAEIRAALRPKMANPIGLLAEALLPEGWKR